MEAKKEETTANAIPTLKNHHLIFFTPLKMLLSKIGKKLESAGSQMFQNQANFSEFIYAMIFPCAHQLAEASIDVMNKQLEHYIKDDGKFS